MAFKRTFAPALSNAANVKSLNVQSSAVIDDGTSRSNAVAKKDLAFWIPLTGPLLREVFEVRNGWSAICLATVIIEKFSLDRLVGKFYVSIRC